MPEDFVTLLVGAREKAGLTQAQVATAAGLTPSYLSFIENRKKPPPSDEVCGRLAEVLGLPAPRLLEAAHLERTPETVRKRLRSLRSKVKREKRSRLRILKSLLSPFLFAGPQGLLDGALDQVSISPTRRRRLREALAAVGRHHQDRAEAVANALEELPERERSVLLKALPKLLDEKMARQAPAGRASAGGAPGVSGAADLRYAPARDATGPYLLEVDADLASGAPRDLAPGDTIVVDPTAEPRAGDLLVLGGGDEPPRVRRLEQSSDGRFFFLHGGPGEVEKAGDRPALDARLKSTGRGTVVEVRRPLRRAATGGAGPASARGGTT